MRVPKNLKNEGRKFWRSVLKEYEFVKTHDLELLTQAAQCIDRMQECRDAIDNDGMFQQNRYGKTEEHPAIKVEKDQNRLFLSIVRELGLTLAPQNPQKGKLY
jgi:P27 family predicted phage terminase small subunit